MIILRSWGLARIAGSAENQRLISDGRAFHGDYLPAVTPPRESSALASAKDGEDSRGASRTRRKGLIGDVRGMPARGHTSQ